MWQKYCRAEQATDETIRRMRIACRIPKATNTHSPYVIITALPQQQWLHERASLLRYTYIACLVLVYIFQSVWHFTSELAVFYKNS